MSNQAEGNPGLVRLDGYQVIEKLGGGGMGTVWRAIQLSTRREVAVKLLNLGLVGSEKARQRFDREVDITSHLQHPNIARIYDSGVHQGAYFYAMELVEGVPLDDYVKSHALSRRQFLQLMLIVCEAVQHAHQRGVIHRDIKPSNIIVSDDGQPHLLDFGLGKYCQTDSSVAEASGTLMRPVTIEGEWAGTPAFMSPEQAAGRVQDLDTRSDVYSLGVLLYHTLTGRYPHNVQGHHVEVLRRIIEEDIVRPRTAQADLDSELEALLVKALAKNPGDRYPTAAALAEDIRNYLEGEPLIARQLTARYFLRRKLRKHRWSVAVVAMALTTLIIGAVVISIRIRHERDLAADWARAEQAQKTLAELRLADSLVLWGPTLRREGRLEDAKARLWEARDLQVAHNVSPIGAEMALLNAFEFSPPPLLQFKTTVSEPTGAYPKAIRIALEGHRIDQVDSSGQCRSYDLSAGREISAVGSPVFLASDSAWMSGQKAVARVVQIKQSDRTEPDPPMIEIFDTGSGLVRHRLPIAGTLWSNVTFSPSGRFVGYLTTSAKMSDDAPGEAPGTLIVLDTLQPDSPPLMKAPVERSDSHGIVAFIDDGSRLLSGSSSLTLWDVGSGQEISRIHDGDSLQYINRIIVSPDQRLAVITNQFGLVSLVDLAGGKVSRKLGKVPHGLGGAAISPDSRRCLIPGRDGGIRMWDVETGELLREFTAEASTAMTTGFSPDGQLVFASNAKGNAWVWNADAGQQHIVSRHDDIVTALALSPDSRVAAVGHGNRSLLINDVATGRNLLHFKLEWPVSSITFSPDGASVVVADDQSGFYRFDLRKGEVIQEFEQLRPRRMGELPPLGRLRPSKTAFSPDGRFSFNYSIKGGVLWDIETGRQLQQIEPAPVNEGTFSRDGQQIVYAVVSQALLKGVRLSDQHRWELKLTGDWGIVTRLCMTPDNQTLLVGHHDGGLRALDLATLTWRWESPGHAHSIRSLAVTGDSRTALSCSAIGGSIILWDIVNGRQLHSFNVGKDIHAATVTPDGRRIVSAAGNGTMTRLWDTNRLAEFRAPQKQLLDAWARLRANPKDTQAAAVCAKWYADAGCFDWAERTLAAAESASRLAEVVSARSLWMTGQPAEASRSFSILQERSNDLEYEQYLALCAYAAKREGTP